MILGLKERKLKQYKIIHFLILIILVSCKEKSSTPMPQDVSSLEATGLTSNKEKKQVIEFGVEYIMGKFNPAKHPDFSEIPTSYADKQGRYMRTDAMQSFADMHQAAKSDGITLTIRSATRNFDYQKGIWERKWTGATTLSDGTNAAKDIKSPIHRARKILEFSSMPGTSRHHWGTDIDINSFNNEYFSNGQGLKEYNWLQANGPKYGFIQVYTAFSDLRPKGYNEEKWHYTYRPVSKILSLEAKDLLEDSMISGFKGDLTPKDISVVENYVLGINPACFEDEKTVNLPIIYTKK